MSLLSKRLQQIQIQTRDEHGDLERSEVDEFGNGSLNYYTNNKNQPIRDSAWKKHDDHLTQSFANEASLNVGLKKSDICERKKCNDFQIYRRDEYFRESIEAEYPPNEENRIAELVKKTYSCSSVNTFLDFCFSKKDTLRAPVSLLFRRVSAGEGDIYSSPKWSEDKLQELQKLKRKLNSVKDKLSEFDLNKWHQHTKSTNPADLVMRRLRSDVKVEFLTQAWCKFYEIVYQLKLIPRSARQENRLYTIHLCEAPGAFVASLNHYLKLNHPTMEWHWKANSLNPYYEGNHLSDMINDDRFMLQTISNWDFGPDLTGDITHPNYPDYLRNQCGDHLPHLVTADGSFDCQDRPEEQENSVAWLHLKETLTALRVLRKGGHFVIKMFTFFECDTVCVLFLMQCVFVSIDVIKPCTSKEGNSEVYVVCRDYKDEPAFQPYLRKLLNASYENHIKFAMFPFERISRAFLKNLAQCAEKFAEIQISVIERNIRLFPYTKNLELRRQFEYMQEKIVKRFIESYEIKPISLSETVVRIPYRKNERHFVIPKVIEQREYKHGSHNDQIRRSNLLTKELVMTINQELKGALSKRIRRVTYMPKLEENLQPKPQNIKILRGKSIQMVYSSQFCHNTFIRIRNELISAVGLPKYTVMTADMKGSEEASQKYPALCDFTKICLLQKTYNEGLLECFYKLYDRLASLQKHDNLTLYSFPLLTQFNVSVLFILGQIFKEVCFEPSNTLHLRDLNEKEHKKWMIKLREIRNVYCDCKMDEEAVISILPIEYITGAKNSFYSWIIETNNDRILHEINLVMFYNLVNI